MDHCKYFSSLKRFFLYSFFHLVCLPHRVSPLYARHRSFFVKNENIISLYVSLKGSLNVAYTTLNIKEKNHTANFFFTNCRIFLIVMGFGCKSSCGSDLSCLVWFQLSLTMLLLGHICSPGKQSYI
jgi:hypothetical protein